MGTAVTANAHEAVLEDPAREEHARNTRGTREELVGHLRHDRAPRAIRAREALVVDRLQAVQVIRHQPEQRRGLGAPGFVDAVRRRRRVGPMRSETRERRAYTRPARGASPSHCATGSSDATSTCRLPNDVCSCRADLPSAHRAASVGPLAAEASVEVVGKGRRGEHARHVDRIVLHRCPLSDERPNDNGAGTPREAAEVLILQPR